MMRNVRMGNISASSYMLPTQKLVSAMTVAPTSTRTQLINKCIFDLFQAGIWQKLDVLWILAAHDEQAGRLNWITPGTYTCTAVNSPTFTTDQGFTGDGTTSYLDTGFIPSTNGVNYASGVGGLGVWPKTNGTALDRTDFGATSDSINMRVTGTSRFQWRSQTTSAINANINTNGFAFKVVNRSSSSAVQLYSDGTSAGTSSQAGTNRSSVAMYILARNNAGTAAAFSDKRIICAYMGGDLTSTEVSNMYTILNTYFTAIGTT